MHLVMGGGTVQVVLVVVWARLWLHPFQRLVPDDHLFLGHNTEGGCCRAPMTYFDIQKEMQPNKDDWRGCVKDVCVCVPMHRASHTSRLAHATLHAYAPRVLLPLHAPACILPDMMQGVAGYARGARG